MLPTAISVESVSIEALHPDPANPRHIGDDELDAYPEEAIAWLQSLGALWRDTSDEGRRQLTLGIFTRIGVVSGAERGSHRIVSIEMTEEAERRGLVLALSASIEVTLVGDTGFEPVTSRM